MATPVPDRMAMQNERSQLADEAVIDAGPLRLCFFRRADRIAHRIVFAASAETILESVEGDPDDDWPPSPALQEVHLNAATANPAALLVGMAGRTHWSASADYRPGGGLRFDIACRVHATIPNLGSSYHIRAGSAEVARSALLIDLPAGKLTVEPGTVEIAIDPQGPVFRVRPHVASGDRPITIRWSYEIAFNARR